jgi:[acyl-carrier-protein] S-malonyltransferase
MQSAADGLAGILGSTAFVPPAMPVASNVDGGYHGDPAAIRNSLCRQVTHPVLWQRCIETMIADGVSEFVEFGPGRVLTGLMRKIDRTVKTASINTVDSIVAAVPA